MEAGEGKKKRDMLGPTHRGPHPSGAPPFGAPTLWSRTDCETTKTLILAQNGLAQIGRDAKNGLAKNGLANYGQIRMAKNGLSPIELNVFLADGLCRNLGVRMVSWLRSPISATGFPVLANTGMLPVTSESQELSIPA